MSTFIHGKELCRGFINDIAEPLLEKNYPGLSYSAGLFGYGSDVLGYDDETSADHMWGSRFYLFLDDENIRLRDGIMNIFQRIFHMSTRASV